MAKKGTKIAIGILIGVIVLINIGLALLDHFLEWSWINFGYLWGTILLVIIVGYLIYYAKNKRTKKEKAEIPSAIPKDEIIENYILGEGGLQFQKGFANLIEEHSYQTRVIGDRDSEKEDVLTVRISKTYYPPFHVVWFFIINLHFPNKNTLIWIERYKEDTPEWKKTLLEAQNGVATNAPQLEEEVDESPDIDPVTGKPTGYKRIRRKRYTRTDKEDQEEQQKENKEETTT